MLPQASLVALKKDTRLVSVQHREDESQEFRLVKEKVPVAMLKAMSGYCKTVLDGANDRSMISITGGVFGAVKEAIDFMPDFCKNKHFLPKPKGIALGYWMRVHEAAELLQIPVLKGNARVEYLTLLESPISEADLPVIASNFPADSPYVGPILDNMFNAIINWHGDWNTWDTDLSKLLAGSTNVNESAFYRVLKTRVDDYPAKLEAESRREHEEQARRENEHEEIEHNW